MSAPEWQPGDRLYPRTMNGGNQYRNYLYNFRDDSTAEDHCGCPDAARWPMPERFDLGDQDPFEAYIAAWHREQKRQESA